MAQFNPLKAVGMVCSKSKGMAVLGTCTAFRRPDFALTAAHCVDGYDPTDLWGLFLARGGNMRSVESLTFHEKADLCVLKLYPGKDDDLGGYPSDAFWGSVGNFGLGEEFMAYGFPVERGSVGPLVAEAAARLIRGSYQRFFSFGSPDGYQFLAGEMSVAATSGMSGGPLFRPGAPPMLTALVVASIETAVEAYKRVEVKNGAETYIEKVDRITEYGVALMLDPVQKWLEECIPTDKASAPTS
jgi:hypothetical protein